MICLQNNRYVTAPVWGEGRVRRSARLWPAAPDDCVDSDETTDADLQQNPPEVQLHTDSHWTAASGLFETRASNHVKNVNLHHTYSFSRGFLFKVTEGYNKTIHPKDATSVQTSLISSYLSQDDFVHMQQNTIHSQNSSKASDESNVTFRRRTWTFTYTNTVSCTVFHISDPKNCY